MYEFKTVLGIGRARVVCDACEVELECDGETNNESVALIKDAGWEINHDGLTNTFYHYCLECKSES